MFDRGRGGLRSNHLYKKQMCRGELVSIQAGQIWFTCITSSQTQDKLKKTRRIQTLPSSLLPFIKIYDGPSPVSVQWSRYHLELRLPTQLPPFLGVWTRRGALILAHTDTASALAADLKPRIHDANLPLHETERCSH